LCVRADGGRQPNDDIILLPQVRLPWLFSYQ
jgi:hypothetical protein